MATIGDSQFLHLSDSRHTAVLPVLERADVMSPLVVLLALLPGLYALHHRAMSEIDAVWGRKCLPLVHATTIEEFIDPALNRADRTPLPWQPPLASWLTALSMRVFGPVQPLSLVFASYLATAGMVASVYLLTTELLGSRVALWTAFLISVHAPLVQMAQSPAPDALAVMTAVLALWGIWHHLLRSGRFVSWELLGGGVAWGLCILSGGPLSVAVIVLVGLSGILSIVHGRAVRHSISERRPESRRRYGPREAVAVCVLLLVGMIVGGWWPAMMSSRYGGEFWIGWIAPANPLRTATMSPRLGEVSALTGALGDFATLLGILVGLWGFGVYRSVLTLIRPREDRRFSSLMFLAGWSLVAFVLWRIWLVESELVYEGMWRGFLLIPCLTIVAVGIDEFAQYRRGRLSVVEALIVAPVAVVLWRKLHPLPEWAAEHREWILGGAAVLMIAGIWRINRKVRDDELRLRRFIAGLLVLLLIGHMWIGMRSTRADQTSDQVLHSLVRQIRSYARQSQSCALITDRRPPERLMFRLQSLCPAASVEQYSSWDEALSTAFTGTQRSQFLIVEWQPETLELSPRGYEMEMVMRSRYFEGRPLRAQFAQRVR